MNAPEAGQTAAAQNMRQNSFGLIVSGVRDRDFIQVMLASASSEKRITQAPRGGLQISSVAFGDRLYCGGRGVKRQFMFARQSGDKFFICLGSAPAKFVIEMQNAERNAEIFLERKKQQ